MMATAKRLRFAVIGAGRGRSFVRLSEMPKSGIELVAICDTNAAALEECKEAGRLRLYTDYEHVLNNPEIDAVCLATPVNLHAAQAIAALNAGKHVLSEVTGIYNSLAEGWDLIATVERSGRTYMMAENYCFSEPVLQVQNMVEQGVFGELNYASGSYIHDCRNLIFTQEGDLTWRGQLRRNVLANGYPTHSLGPIARWMDINRTDSLETTATWNSRSSAIPHYANRNHPDRTEYADPNYWAHADTVSTSIRTEKGRLIDLRFDAVSPRPHHMTRFELQGTKASFSWPDGPQNEPLIWIEGRSPTNEQGIAQEWEPLFKYRDEFQHPLWREHGAEAASAGHSGGDYFILREFSAAILGNRPPLIDVYDAVAWSSIIPLSAESIAKGNAPVRVPNFKESRK
ncbi:Gfo/Idh/MocA family oxidoreductase [soil metagenome]